MITFENKKLKDLTFIDLFAGIGGFRMALESLGATCVFSSEINPKSAETYEKNFGEKPFGDITIINEQDIPYHDILCAGFPCQAFSASGKKMGFADTRGTLFFEVARIVKAKQPKVVFLENVQFFMAHDGGKTINVVRSSMEELGYTFNVKVLNAVDYGVPQFRRRTYMVCFRKDLHIDSFQFPYPRPLFSSVNEILLEDNEEIEKLYFHRNDLYSPNLKTSTDPKNVHLVYFYNKAGQGERIYNPDGVCITLATMPHEKFLFPKGIRRLHQRECARLMGFPDSFWIPKSFTEAHRQLGNSVVIDVIQYIANDIGGALIGEDAEFSLF